jgi:hypothetical protein
LPVGVKTQFPASHSGVLQSNTPHECPHDPQWLGSRLKSVQPPLQNVLPDGQSVGTQVPELQTPAPFWQEPFSLVGLVAQPPLAQTGALHSPPPPQTLPHAPQFAWSAWKPVVAMQTPLQSVKPGLHMNPHVPATQVAAAFATLVVQAWPQAPQFAGSVWYPALVTQAPLQRVKPGMQAELHVPFAQVALPSSGVGQAWLQSPQCSTSVARLTSQPLADVPSQLA